MDGVQFKSPWPSLRTRTIIATPFLDLGVGTSIADRPRARLAAVHQRMLFFLSTHSATRTSEGRKDGQTAGSAEVGRQRQHRATRTYSDEKRPPLKPPLNFYFASPPTLMLVPPKIVIWPALTAEKARHASGKCEDGLQKHNL